jgi:hypothetical protein
MADVGPIFAQLEPLLAADDREQLPEVVALADKGNIVRTWPLLLSERPATCAVLAAKPGDADATAIKGIALLKQGEFSAAVAAFETGGLADKFLFERAYCLYRENKLDQCSALIASVPAGERTEAILNLEAQLVRAPPLDRLRACTLASACSWRRLSLVADEAHGSCTAWASSTLRPRRMRARVWVANRTTSSAPTRPPRTSRRAASPRRRS